MKIKTTTVIVFLIAFFANISYAGDIKDEQQNRDVRSEYKEFKDHHLKDNHSFKIFYYKKDKKKKIYFVPASNNSL